MALVVTVAGAAEPADRPPVAAPDSPIALGSSRELFVDRLLIERLDNAALKLHEPVSAGVAVRLDKPWEGKGMRLVSCADEQSAPTCSSREALC